MGYILALSPRGTDGPDCYNNIGAYYEFNRKSRGGAEMLCRYSSWLLFFPLFRFLSYPRRTDRKYISAKNGLTLIPRNLSPKPAKTGGLSSINGLLSPVLHCSQKKKKQQSIAPNLVESGVWPISAPHKAFFIGANCAPHSRPEDPKWHTTRRGKIKPW